ncbi:hypothetical protein AB0J63_01400 [Streptosporangium canum]|uniref:hypothetical protein n=1 Tax=Streptosporangium canum TaxID=324952 RepID=UPI003416CB8C
MTQQPSGESLEDICVEYFALAFPDADASWIDEQATSMAEQTRQSMRITYQPSPPQTREHLTQALAQLNDHGLSPHVGSANVQYHGITVTADTAAVPGGRGELRLTLTGSASGYPGTWLALTAGRADLRYLAGVDADGSATFGNLPAADWAVELVDEVSAPSAVIPLPVVRPLPRAAAAAANDFALVLPNGALFRMSRSGPRASYVLEITAISPELYDGPDVYSIRYVSDGATLDLLVPVASRHTAPRSRVHLPGFSDDDRWETSAPLRPDAVPPAEELIARSVEAVVDRATLRAWHTLVPHLPSDVAEIVSACLARR